MHLLKYALIGVVVATGLAGVGWSATIALSVLVGGVMGLANLWLWTQLVRALLARQEGVPVTATALAARMLVKLLLLVLMCLVVSRTTLAIFGVAAGFGSALLGMVWASWCLPCAAPPEAGPQRTNV